MNMSTTANVVACNCTGECRPPTQGGKGRCSSLPGRAIPLPVCNLCGEPWEAGHDCTTGRLPESPLDRTRHCPCRVENGGSGICGCILGSQVIC